MTDYEEKRSRLRRKVLESIELSESGCWEWTRSTDKGYGKCSGLRSHSEGAHRVSYEAFVGPIGDGLQIDHLCRNTLCVNPSHLEPVTPRENVRRSNSVTAQNWRKSECVRGHKFDHENTRVLANGGRQCKKCENLRKVEQRRRRTAAGIPEGVIRSHDTTGYRYGCRCSECRAAHAAWAKKRYAERKLDRV